MAEYLVINIFRHYYSTLIYIPKRTLFFLCILNYAFGWGVLQTMKETTKANQKAKRQQDA